MCSCRIQDYPIDQKGEIPQGMVKPLQRSDCIVLYSSIYIAPLNSREPTEVLWVRLAPRKETGFKTRYSYG